jgi:serine/threonine protein kinase
VPAVATVAGLPNKLGKYELLMPLAAGGMARIYIGRSTGIGSFERHVVLKLITPERANDHTTIQMFLDEARLAASLNHQNVAQVFEVGEDLGIHYLAMEYVHGQDMRALLAKAGSQGTRIPLDLALTVVAGAAAGLNHAHERRAADGTPLGIVHRDVSPSNIMVGYDGSVKLLDFGIAKATSRSVETQSGIIKGKFAYMAPEQCRGRDVDRRSDVFSLGIILYEVTTQHRCFRADSDFDTMHRIVTGDVVRPTRLVQGYPPALESIVMKALAVDAVQRYQSAGALLEALEAFAIASRYSLSTMGLGRFMRDMFGEISEPWLGNWASPVAPKESTISSTDGRSEVGPSPLHDRAQTDSMPVEDSEARFPESAGIRDMSEPASESDGEALTMVQRPTPQPQRAEPEPEPPIDEPDVVTEFSTAKPVPPMAQMAAMAATMSTGPQQPPIATTRHGYASGGAMTAPGGPLAANDRSYPRYEATGDDVESLRLRPNRLLYLAVAVLALGVIAMIAILVGGSGTPKDNDGIANGSADTTGSDPAGSAAVVAPPAPVQDTYVTIKVGSQPRGADVLIAGDKVGVTPFEGKLKRATQTVPLVVRMVGYADFTSKIDLSDEYTNDKISLAKLAPVEKPAPPDAAAEVEPTEDTGSATETATPVVETPKEPKHPQTPVRPVQHPSTASHPTTHPAITPPVTHAPKCQPNGQINPYDTSCDGKACPPCK